MTPRQTVHWQGRVPLVAALVLWCCMGTSAYGQVAVLSPAVVERVARPGESYRDAIVVENTTDQPQSVAVSVVDYLFDAAGQSVMGDKASHLRSGASWTTVSQRSVQLAPRATARIEYTVDVPAGDNALPGTHWSVVLVQAVQPIPAPTAHGGFSVTVALRHAIQVVTHIGEAGSPRLTFSPPVIEGQQITFDVLHVGERACRPALQLSLYTADGVLVADVSAQRGLLYPTTGLRQRFDLPELAPGPYIALIMADVGEDEVQGARFEIAVR